jgi:predicted transcriptional regulator
MGDILFLPVKPRWAKLIMSGKKTLELRKRLPTRGYGNQCVIYASSPQCEIVGTCVFVDCGRIVTLDNDLLDRACVTRSEYDAYFGQGEGHAIVLSSPHVFMHGISLATMRERWKLEPPQQWRYIDRKTLDEIYEAGR